MPLPASSNAEGRLTAVRLRRLISYDPTTGEFRWIQPQCSRLYPGDIAGYVHKKCGYRRIRIDDVQFAAHRLAWLYVYGKWPAAYIDHISGDRGNNRIANLREATHAQNMANRRRTKDDAPYPRGVALDRCGRYQVYYQKKFIGTFATPEEAGEAYRAVKIERYGEFARVD
jgi:hypothetical protein